MGIEGHISMFAKGALYSISLIDESLVASFQIFSLHTS